MKYAVIYLIAVNIITFCLYGLDKHAAIKQKTRTPNRVLIGFAALGGSIGALAGMYTFRHKTRTKLYTITVPLLLIMQIITVILIIYPFGN